MPAPVDDRLMDHAFSMREMLQKIENALLKAGYDDITVATESGTFHWMTVERARERESEK